MFDRRLVLLATPRQIGALDWRPGNMHWLGEFDATGDGLLAFREAVKSHVHQPALVVADTVDEDYRSEILPHVQGRAREEMVARKLRQVFRNARFTGAWRQGRETTGRRDDRYLFAALTDADWLTPWLAVLEHERAPLAGIAPLALACQHLVTALRIQDPHVLLAYRLNNRLRLSYYHNGLLRFSRLIGSDVPAAPGNAADEIAKTQLYLTGQRILPREARLHVVLIDPAGQLDSAQARLNADPAFSTRLVGLPALAQALRMPSDFLAATPAIAPLAAIAGAGASLNLAPHELLLRHTEFRWRRNLHVAAGAVALAGVTLTGAIWLHAQGVLDQAGNLDMQRQQLDARYREIARTFPQDLPDPAQLARTVALAQTLKSPPVQPETLFALLSRALQETPGIQLDAFAWTDGGPIQHDARTLRIEAAVAPFDGNYRAAMLHIDAFMRALRAAPAVGDVRLHTSPVDTDSARTLSGKTFDAQSGGAAPAARFSVEVALRGDAA